jgi:hypothetical protein
MIITTGEIDVALVIVDYLFGCPSYNYSSKSPECAYFILVTFSRGFPCPRVAAVPIRFPVIHIALGKQIGFQTILSGR